ncbi:MAG: proline--tRNA ligase [Pseudomonadota bacterium]
MTLPGVQRLSQFFMPTLRDTPAEAQIASHRYMLRAGMIRQSAAGIYSWLPLGFRCLKKIEQIVREEQDRAGANELLMATIQPAELWQESGRYEDYGKEMLRIHDRHERDLLYGPTNEEVITAIFRDTVHSYRDLPKIVYHMQWKFRDEVRPRFGVMRGREFYMKDGYSFDVSLQEGLKSYRRMFVSYLRTYARLDLCAVPMQADTGPIGGSSSHEFIILADTGESEVFYDKRYLDLMSPPAEIDFGDDEGSVHPIVSEWTQYYAATEELHDQARFDAMTPKAQQSSGRGIEVGHIFFFGDKYSKPMQAHVVDRGSQSVALQSGSYGIAVSRLVGATIEACHDDNGIKWPESTAPFVIGLLNLGMKDANCLALCDDLVQMIDNAGLDVLYDDRDLRAGEKFANMDLIGLPWHIIVGTSVLAKVI